MIDHKLNDWFNALPIAAPTTHMCDKCHENVRSDDRNAIRLHFDGLCLQPLRPINTDTTPKLSLLIIDLGESCVVKVEKLERPTKIGDVLQLFNSEPQLIRFSFANVRDALDGEKPVPRIEPDIDSDYPTDYRVFSDKGGNLGVESEPIDKATYDALCKLAGNVKIPIYEPIAGTWKRLYPVELAMMSSEPTMARQARDEFNAIMPLAVWRYTR